MSKGYFSSAVGFRRGFVGGLVMVLCSSGAIATTKSNGERWVDIWGSMPQLVEPANLPPVPYNGTDAVFRDATLRQTVYITQDASTIRLQFSNAFGGSDLPITAATVALPSTNGSSSSGAGSSAILPSTLQPVTFSGGSPSFTIPNGALAISDPIRLPVKAQSVLTITLYLSGQPGHAITGHPGSRTTSFLAPGNQVSTTDLKPLALSTSTDHWYFLSTIQGLLPSTSSSLAIIGDSITDGRGSTTNLNNRWPDRLLSRLQSFRSLKSIPTINQAAGGNRLLADGLGPNALGRIERDVLAHPNTKYALVFIGVNDIGTSPLASLNQTSERMISAYKQIITRLHGAGIAVFGATITPMSGPGTLVYADPQGEREALRGVVNKWIREGDGGRGKGGIRFDAVVDFDEAVRDKGDLTRLDGRFDSGDYLHLNPAGYEALGAAVDLGLFERFRGGFDG